MSLCVVVFCISWSNSISIFIYSNEAFTELTLDLNRQFRNKRSNIIHSLWIINLYLFWLIQHRSFNIWNSSILITSNENRLKWGLQKSCDENLKIISDCILFEPDMNLFASSAELRVVQTKAILFLNSMSDRLGSDIQRHWN